ncbi:MAG: ester cyclase [Lysobacterales bacterium]
MNRTGLLLLASLAMLAGCCGLPSERTESRNIDVIRKVFSEVWSKGNVDLIDELYARDYIGHFPGETFHGLEGIRSHVTAHRTAFHDWTEEIEDIIADRDTVAVRFSSRGTNLGKFFDSPPTEKHVRITEATIFKLEDGKIVEQWVYPDILSLQSQLRSQQP